MKRTALLLVLLPILLLLAFAVSSPDRVSAAATTEIVSLGNNNQQGNAGSMVPALSADGRLVAFQSDAGNLVPNDNNGTKDVFVRDRTQNTLRRVSVRSDGGEAAGDSSAAAISGDGRWISFQSTAGNLVNGDTNGASDIFLHDLQTSITTRISVSGSGQQGNAASYDPAISYDGRYIAFWSLASNLSTADTNSRSDVFVHDRVSGATFRVSVAGNGQQANDSSSYPSISDDGRYIAFESYASNLVANDLDGYKDIFVHDWVGLATERVSLNNGGQSGSGDSFGAAISRNSAFVAFTSLAANLVPGDANNHADVFLYNRDTNQIQRVSIGDGENEANGSSGQASLAGGGDHVVFRSQATNLVGNDGNGQADVFLRDVPAGSTELISVGVGGVAPAGLSEHPVVAVGGTLVMFDSTAPNVVIGDANGVHDVFARDRIGPPPPTPTPIPRLVGNHNIGRPGSSFAFSGTAFTPGVTAFIDINGVQVGSLTVGGSGTLSFEICSAAQAEEGTYAVTATAGASAGSAVFRLDSAAANLWGSTGVTPVYCIPGNIALQEERFMPLNQRD